MFEVTPEDIAQLDDEQLRTLVALLCEAELRQRGYSTAGVTWGGDQTAKDGGLDVRVSLPPDKSIEGYIPRQSTGFQVKKPDMPQRTIRLTFAGLVLTAQWSALVASLSALYPCFETFNTEGRTHSAGYGQASHVQNVACDLCGAGTR